MESQSVVYWITVCSLWWPHSTAWSSSTNLWMTTALCLSLTTGSVDLLIDSPGKSAMSCQILPAFLITSLRTTKIHPSPLTTTEYTDSQYYLWSLPLACRHPWWKRCLTPLLTLKTYSDQYHWILPCRHSTHQRTDNEPGNLWLLLYLYSILMCRLETFVSLTYIHNTKSASYADSYHN